MNQEKIKNRIDYKKLVATLAIQTKSRDDEAMLSYIRERLKSMDVTVQEDGYGNIYVTKGNAKAYPCVIAHTDTVHSVLKDISIYRNDDTIFAFDPVKRTQCGIGGDDKVGVYIALQLLEDITNLKAVFFRDEEIGCPGSTYGMKNHAEWFKDCNFVLMADRKGNMDVITVSGGIVITSEEFLNTCDPIFKKYGYKDAVGTFTDIDVLATYGVGVSCVNFSSGYWDPHSSREFVSISDVNDCYNLMYDIIIEHGDTRFEYKAEIPAYKQTYKRAGQTVHSSLLADIIKTGAATPIGKRQLKMFPPLVLGGRPDKYDLFTENDVIKGKYKIYMYKGSKSLVLTGDATCSKCKHSVMETVFFLPYEGRMYCTECNDYINDAHVPMLLQALEVEDGDTVFVYSLYSAGWLPKEEAKWSTKISSWVSTQLPF